MTRKHRHRFVLLLLVLATLLAVEQTVQACVCAAGDDSTLGKFETARFVVVSKIISVNKQLEFRTVYGGAEVVREPITTITSITTIIEKVYKGALKVGDEMVFGQGKNADCLEEFQEEDVGAKFLFYLNPGKNKPKLWHANSCGRTKPLPDYQTDHIEDAADDLLYLEKINEVRGQTRISGTLISYQWTIADGGADFKRVGRRKVRIVGNGKSYEALTNDEGAYEIYDLPPGTYAIRPEGKQGWAIDEQSAFGAQSSGEIADDGSARVRLRAGRHAYADFVFKVDNHLSGRVFDESGRPLQGVCLSLLPTQLNVSEDFKRVDCTDAEGRFKIDEIPFASYVVVLNNDGRISSEQPFRRFYYPDVTDRNKAQIFTIVEGVTEYPLDIQVTGVSELVTVTGRVLTADGKPVVFARIGFTADQTDPRIDGNVFAMTDQRGNFSLNILKGLSGRLVAAMTLDPAEFKGCPTLLRTNGEFKLDRKTEPIRIQAVRHLDGVNFRFTFSSCGREKIFSRNRID